MSESREQQVTQILAGIERGEAGAADRLLPLVYDELRELADSLFRRERAGHTLQPTALVHEAYVRLVKQTRVEWKGRAHFLAVAAQAMRRILINHAESRRAAKRGGAWHRITVPPRKPIRANLRRNDASARGQQGCVHTITKRESGAGWPNRARSENQRKSVA